MKFQEEYGFFKALIAVVLLLLSALFLNTLVGHIAVSIFSSIIFLDLPLSLFVVIIAIKNCVAPAIIEELLRNISCRKGWIATVLFPLLISLGEHYISYGGEPFYVLLLRFGIHGLLTAIHCVGFKEKKPMLFLLIAIGCHFMNNLKVLFY